MIDEFGAAFKEYRELWEETSAGGKELSFPIHLDIELNPSCNLKCPMCIISNETNLKSSTKYWMSFENYQRLIDEGVKKGLKSIQLNNINEPLIRADIPDFIAYAKKMGVLDIMLATNATLLSKKMASSLIHAGLTKLSVSIDSHSKEIYDKVRVGGKYEEVVSNTLQFIKLRDEMGKNLPLLKITFVNTPMNEHELEDFINYWNDKADMISIQNFNNPFDGDLWEKTSEYFEHNPKLVDKTDKICPHPFQRMTIQHDGMALLCCNLRGPDLPIGNTFEKGLEAIYNGKTAKNYRKLHAEGRYHEIETCRKCIQFSNLE